jgi:hypothetical protein
MFFGGLDPGRRSQTRFALGYYLAGLAALRHQRESAFIRGYPMISLMGLP